MHPTRARVTVVIATRNRCEALARTCAGSAKLSPAPPGWTRRAASGRSELASTAVPTGRPVATVSRVMLAEHGADQGRAAEPAEGRIHALRAGFTT